VLNFNGSANTGIPIVDVNQTGNSSVTTIMVPPSTTLQIASFAGTLSYSFTGIQFLVQATGP
jgi:hypothetical protein